MQRVDQKIYSNAGNRAVLDLVPIGTRTVLDVGCGAGDNARVLQSRGMIVDGITFSPAEAALARAYCRRVMVFDLEDGLPKGLEDVYDACICSHVLEHICWPQSVLRAVYDKIRGGGILITALPNLMMWRYRLPLILGKFEYEETGVMDRTHFRWYTFESARHLFLASGFQVERAMVEGAFPLSFFRRCLPGAIISLIDSLAGRLAPGFFGLQMIFVLSSRVASQNIDPFNGEAVAGVNHA